MAKLHQMQYIGCMRLPIDEKGPLVNPVALVQSGLATRSSLANGLKILLSVATKLTVRLREFEGKLNSMVTMTRHILPGLGARLTPYEQLRRRQESISQARQELQAKIDDVRSQVERARLDHNRAWGIMLELQAKLATGLRLLDFPPENGRGQDSAVTFDEAD